jgi:hypothetical protein
LEQRSVSVFRLDGYDLNFAFLPDFTVRKAQRETSRMTMKETHVLNDFIAGGCAGSASVIVGHPRDTIRCAYKHPSSGILCCSEFGGPLSLFRGWCPLGAAVAINNSMEGIFHVVLVLVSLTNMLCDQTLGQKPTRRTLRSLWQKLGRADPLPVAIPVFRHLSAEHVKCRLQTQQFNGPGQYFKGPLRYCQGYYPATWNPATVKVGVGRPLGGKCSHWSLHDMQTTRRIKSIHVLTQINLPIPLKITIHSTRVDCLGYIWWPRWLHAISWIYPLDVDKTRVQAAPLDAARQTIHVARG